MTIQHVAGGGGVHPSHDNNVDDGPIGPRDNVANGGEGSSGVRHHSSRWRQWQFGAVGDNKAGGIPSSPSSSYHCRWRSPALLLG
jgi:hypothetical protein